MAQLAILGQSKRVQISLYVQNDGELRTAADFNDRGTSVVDSSRLSDHSCRRPDAALSRFVVAARVNEAGIGQEQRMVATACRVDDVESLQARHQRWLLVSLQFRLSQLCEVVTSYKDCIFQT